MKHQILTYIALNIFAFALAGYDKYCAIHDLWRVSEKALFLVALIGGAPGEYLAMRLFRHKTRHMSFMIGLPAIIVLQIILFIYINSRFFGR